MKLVVCLLMSLLFHLCKCEDRDCKNCSKRKSELTVEQLRLLRYEYLKNQILQKLHLKEAPKTNSPKPPMESLFIVAGMAENETFLEAGDQPKVESVVIYPKNDNLICLENPPYGCTRFELNFPESLRLENLLSAEVWISKKHASFIRTYRILLQNSSSVFELDNTITMEKSWTRCIVSPESFKSNDASENILVVEIIAGNIENDADNSTEGHGSQKPFLVLRSEANEKISRWKRNTNCIDTSPSCCKENFFLNFSEIGWDNWILHPEGYHANFCRGRCFNDLSNTRFYHGTILLSYIRDNKDIAEEIGLNMCCTPSVMAPVTIIYRNEENLIYHKSIENMKVEACDCA